MNNAYSIGIIGGADGPTSIIVSGGFPWILPLSCIIGIGILLWLIRHKK